jgi:hypothetical protein
MVPFATDIWWKTKKSHTIKHEIFALVKVVFLIRFSYPVKFSDNA